MMMVAVFSLLWFLYSHYVLHSSQSLVIRFTLSLIFFRPSERSKLFVYHWHAALFVVLNGIWLCCVG